MKMLKELCGGVPTLKYLVYARPMIKQLGMLLLCLGLAVFPIRAFLQEKSLIGYKGVSWGSPPEAVLKALPPTADSNANCEKDITHETLGQASDALKELAALPGLKWGSEDRANYPYSHSRKFSLKKVGEGCGIFFDGKYVAQRLSHFGSLNNGSVLKALEEKYGKFKEYSSKGFLIPRSVSYLKTSNTLIVFYAQRGNLTTDLPEIWYISNQHQEALAASLAEAEKEMPKDRKGQPPSIQGIKDAL